MPILYSKQSFAQRHLSCTCKVVPFVCQNILAERSVFTPTVVQKVKSQISLEEAFETLLMAQKTSFRLKTSRGFAKN